MKGSKKKVRIIKGLIIILAIVLIIMAILFIKTKETNRETMRNRVVEGIDNLNYVYNDKTNRGSQVFVVGKLAKKIDDENRISYFDYKNKKTTDIVISTHFLETYSNNGISDMKYYKDYVDGYFNNNDYDYEYNGQKEENGQKYLIINFIQHKKANKRLGVEFWINDKTNVIDKIIKYTYKDNKKEVYEEVKTDFASGGNIINDITIPVEIISEYSSDTNN